MYVDIYIASLGYQLQYREHDLESAVAVVERLTIIVICRNIVQNFIVIGDIQVIQAIYVCLVRRHIVIV